MDANLKSVVYGGSVLLALALLAPAAQARTLGGAAGSPATKTQWSSFSSYGWGAIQNTSSTNGLQWNVFLPLDDAPYGSGTLHYIYNETPTLEVQAAQLFGGGGNNISCGAALVSQNYVQVESPAWVSAPACGSGGCSPTLITLNNMYDWGEQNDMLYIGCSMDPNTILYNVTW